MLNTDTRPWLLGGIWLAALAVIVAFSVSAGARLSTSALLLVVGAVPLGVLMRMGRGVPPPTVAEILYEENSKSDSR